jgi:amino acid transporter
VPALMLIVMGTMAWLRFGAATEINSATILPSTGLKNIVFWSTIAFAFGGIEGASTMSEEIRDARRNIPRAILAAGVIVTIVYIAGTASVLAALPTDAVTGLQGFMQAMTQVSARVGFEAVVPFVALLVTVSSIGGVSAWFTASARLPFLGGIDKFLPPAFGRLHPRWRTPYVALIVQSVIAAVVIFLGQAGTSVKGAYDVLVSMGIISYFLPFLYMFSAMIRLQREPAGPEVMRVPGGKPVAIILSVLGLLTTIVSSILACIPPADEPNKFLAVTKIIGSSALMIAIGAVIYLIGKRKRAA